MFEILAQIPSWIVGNFVGSKIVDEVEETRSKAPSLILLGGIIIIVIIMAIKGE